MPSLNPVARLPDGMESGGELLAAAALAFHLEAVPGASAARIIWPGESPWTATARQPAQREAADNGVARRSVVDEARAWLRETLTAGPRLAR